MAIVRAVKSGNWSDPTTWNTGALPTAADDVYSNTFTVTIDVSPTVLSISNAAASGVTAGGTFLIQSNGVTLTANVIAGSSGVALNVSILSGSSSTVIGSLTGGIQSQSACSFSGEGVLNIIGTLTGGRTNTGAHALGFSSTGTVNITGFIFGGTSGSSNHGVNFTGGGTLSVTGDIIGGLASVCHGIQFSASSSGSLYVTGNCIGNTANTNAINTTSGSCLVFVSGTITASNAAAGLFSSSASATVNLTGLFITSANGTNPVYALNWKWASTAPSTYYQVRTSDTNIIRSLYTADSVGGNPAITNVRSGTVYGPAGELTGTCAVPPAGSVALGVPVDNTTGTAVLTQANFQAALTAQGLTSTRAGYLDNLDATVSSRLAPDGTLSRVTLVDTATTLTNAPTVPSAVEIADQVRVELGPELDRVSNCSTTDEVGNIIQQAVSG